jgi:hypothetical protein
VEGKEEEEGEARVLFSPSRRARAARFSLTPSLTLLGAGRDERVLHPGRGIKVLGGRVRQGGGQGEVVELLGGVDTAAEERRGRGERGWGLDDDESWRF